MSDPTVAPEPSGAERHEIVIVLLGGLYTAAFTGFIAYFVYCALTGL